MNSNGRKMLKHESNVHLHIVQVQSWLKCNISFRESKAYQLENLHLQSNYFIESQRQNILEQFQCLHSVEDNFMLRLAQWNSNVQTLKPEILKFITRKINSLENCSGFRECGEDIWNFMFALFISCCLRGLIVTCKNML